MTSILKHANQGVFVDDIPCDVSKNADVDHLREFPAQKFLRQNSRTELIDFVLEYSFKQRIGQGANRPHCKGIFLKEKRSKCQTVSPHSNNYQYTNKNLGNSLLIDPSV